MVGSVAFVARAGRVARGTLVVAATLALNAVALTSNAEVAPVAGIPRAADTSDQTVRSVVDGWADDPVYVDPGAAAFLAPADASDIRQRVADHEPPVFVAAVPARALSESPGSTDAQRARAFLDAVVDGNDRDGVYLVSFAGAGTYGSAVGVDLPVGPILEDRLGDFTLSQAAPLLHAVLDDLGVAGSPETAGESGRGWLIPVLIAVVVVVIGVVVALWLRRRRRGDSLDGGDVALGPSTYRPSFDVLPDEADTPAERRALAREDVTRFGEELDEADLDVSDPQVAEDVQAAMDAYAEAARTADGDPDDDTLRSIRATVEYGRWRLARGRARLTGAPTPARRAPCFIDPEHGVSVADWRYRPADGVARDVPVCAACLRRMEESGR